MAKVPFVTKEQLDEIVKKYPTPFHLYDEKGIRETARGLYKAFSWNKGFKENGKSLAKMLPFNNDTSDIDQSIEMVRFQCGPDSRDACRINILFNRKELIYGR